MQGTHAFHDREERLSTPEPPEDTLQEQDEIRPLEQVDRALMNILDQVRAHTGAARASLFLRDPETGEAVTRVAHLEKLKEIRVPPGRGIVGAVLARDRVLTWPGDAPDPDRESQATTGYSPTNILAIPVRLDAQPVGVLQLLDGSLEPHARRRAEGMAARLERILGRSSLARQLRPRGERPVSLHYAFEGMVGASPAMRAAFELAARVLHTNSKRAGGPLVKVNCGAIPETLLESQLFGHEKGAFTGAVQRNEGLVAGADGGTLFLDEIGELSLTAQTRLLRVLEEKVVQPVGGGKPRPVDFRLVSATHRDLAAMARAGDFRADLYHRLKVVRIRLPGLRERGEEDILRLVEHFAQLHSERHERPVKAIPAATQKRLTAHHWSGNVRELSHAVESAVVLSLDGVLTPELFEFEDTSLELTGGNEEALFETEPTFDALERRYLAWLMHRYEGRRSEVAQVAGIGRSTLWRRLKEMGYSDE